MADVKITGAGRLDLVDHAEKTRALACAMWMATHYLTGSDHDLTTLAALIEDRITELVKLLNEAAGLGSTSALA